MSILDQNKQLSQLNDEEKRALLAKLLLESKRRPQLSVTQERMWQLSQIAPGNPVYNFQSAIALTGPLNYNVLSQSLSRIVARHETLRTCFGNAQGKPKLEVVPSLSVVIDMIDWSGRNSDEQASALQAAATTAAQAGFAIDQPPLFRLQCFRMSIEHHVLVLTMHHIVSDLLSLDLFFQELGNNYGDIVDGKNSSVVLPKWTYQDHARDEHAGRTALRQGPAAQFWREHLAGAPDLPWHSDFPRPLKPTGQAATAHFALDAAVVRTVVALARSEGVTPFVVLLSVYYILQWAASGSDDQLVGVPTAGRNREDAQGLIGMFSSPLPMRAHLSGQLTFRELLLLVRQTVLGAAEHSALPFADIVENAHAAGSGKRLALRSMFSFVSRMKILSFPGLQLQRVPTNRGVSDFDLFLTIYEDNGSWRGVFEYSTDLFGSGTAQDWADAYSKIVSSIATEPVKTVTELAAFVMLPPTVQIAVAATFTADLLEEAVDYWQRELRWPVRMVFSPYNQVFQTLLDPASELRFEGNTLNVILVRPEDWIRYSEDSAERRDILAKATDDFIAAACKAKLRAPLVVYLCPSSPGTADQDVVTAAESRIEAELVNQAGITVLRAEAAMARYGIAEAHDAQANEIGHIPFSRTWYAALGTELVRRATSMKRPPFKVIALDCDNTLWRGVCGEDGAQGVRVDSPFRALQEFVLAQAETGMLLCLVSKNEVEDVFRVFDENTAMLLKRDRIIGHRINWQPKSANLRALAAELQLGLDSFVFIDDNPVECAEVQAACPEVLTLCLPQNVESIPSFLQNVWALDRHHVSAEDRKRADSMLENKHRDVMRQQTSSLSEFISKLELQVQITPVDDVTLPRLAQLSQRTNQFNNTGVRYDEAGLRDALMEGFHALEVSVTDRFGQYGIVGALIYRIVDSVLRVESFLLSCRVLGRGVEHRMLTALGRIARESELAAVRIAFRDLPRNQPFRRFLTSLQGTYYDDGMAYVLTTAEAEGACFDPEQYGTEKDVQIVQATAATTSSVHNARQAALASIASWLGNIDDIMARLDLGSRRVRGSSVGTPPQGETECSIARIWQDVLRIDVLSRDDNFFEVGGNSLLLVQVNSRLIEHFERDIQITTLFQFPTIASLANHFSNSGNVAQNRAKVQARGEKARLQMQQRMERLGGMRR